jgi:hypothetical protein
LDSKPLADADRPGDVELRLVIAEYQALRADLLEHMKAHYQLMSLWTTALMALVGGAVIYGKPDALLFLPLFSVAFALRWTWSQNNIQLISRYLLLLECPETLALPTLSDAKAAIRPHGFAWQSYWLDNAPSPWLYFASYLVLFVLIPIGMPVVYATLVSTELIKVSSAFSPLVHEVLVVLFCLVGCGIVLLEDGLRQIVLRRPRTD